uniref:Undifferentiated embryonic cell transcription factor 1 n=1 Tax=Jaculus jaculus TaxID=51337 RepID=A0A8C5L842_JACJA
MLLRPRRPPSLAPPAMPSRTDFDVEMRPDEEDAPRTHSEVPTTPGALTEPGSPKSPVSPGSAQRTPWSARETELLLDTLLQPTVWRSLLLDRRQALPTYRRVSAALARQQVLRTPAQCRRRYKFLKDKLRDSQGQPSGPYDAQIRELMGLLGDKGHRRVRRRPSGPGRPQRGRRSTITAVVPAADESDPDPASALRYSASTLKSVDDSRCASRSPPAPTALFALAPEPRHVPASPRPPTPDPAPEDPDVPPRLPEDRASPPAAVPSLNAALLQTLTHLGDIVTVLGPLSDQLSTLNQHVDHLRGSFDQTVSLAVGFILGSAAAERGVLGDPPQ